MLAQRTVEILGFVVDRCVEAQLVAHVRAFLRTPGDSDHATPLDPRDLSHRHPHGPGRTRHHHGVAGYRAADVEEPEVRGHPRHPKHVQVHRQRRDLRIHLRQAGGFERGVLLDVERPIHVVTLGHGRRLTRDDDPDAAGPHGVADPDGRDVRPALVHPPTHRRVEREVEHLDQRFAILRLARDTMCEFPVTAFRHADGAGGEFDLQVLDGAHVVDPLQGGKFREGTSSDCWKKLPRSRTLP